MADEAASSSAENLKLVQLQLLLILHAHKCQRAECKYNHCKTASNIITHMKTCTCRDIVCTFSHCRSSRRLINHWRHCTPTRQCQLCLPLHNVSISTNDYSSLFEIFLQSTTLAARTSTSRDNNEVAEVAKPSKSRDDSPKIKQKSKKPNKSTNSPDNKKVAELTKLLSNHQERKQKNKNPNDSTAASPDNKEIAEVAELLKTRDNPPKIKQNNKKPNDSTTASSGADNASGIINNKIGIDYHFFVAMYSCLNGYKIKQSNSSYEFTIKQECKGVGMFDDIVYKYRESKSEEWTRLLIQVKYKQADNKIKSGNLLYDDKKETFSLIKFIKSTKDIEDIENCLFIIFTSASLDLEDDGHLRKWYKKGVPEPITLLPSEVSCVPVFDKDSHYKFSDPENIPKFVKYSGIDKEDEWKTFLNKLVFVTGSSNLDHAEKTIEQTIEDILPKSTEIIWNRLYKIVDSGLKTRAEITSEQISDLFETVEEEIQKGQDKKYEECEIDFESDLPEVYQFLSSEYSTLPVVSTNSELTLIKVCKIIKKLRQEKTDIKKYILKHVYSIKEVKDIRKAASCNLLIITIKNNDQLDLFESLKNDDQKYITIISNDINVSGIQNCYQLYRDVDHSFKLLTDKSKQYVLNEPCVSFNGQEFSFKEILQVNSNSLTKQQVKWLNSVITEDVLICFLNEEYKTLNISFNSECINELGVYIKRRLIYAATIEENQIENFQEVFIIDDFKNFKTLCEEMPDVTIHYFIKRKDNLLWVQTNGDTKYLKQFIKKHRTNGFIITEDELCGLDVNTVLISDMPGMGKSTLISSVFNELQNKHRAQIIIRLNFNDHTNSFSKKDLQFNSFEKTVEFIINELLAKAKLSKLSQNVLNYTLQSKNTIFLFLDGFDEICPDYNDIVVNFIKSLMKYTNCKLFVTTRPGQTNTLQRVLSTFALSIQPFTEQDKLSYLDKILETKNIDTEELLEKINENSKLTELLGVPLLLKIVAETLKNEKDDKININVFNLSQLFKKFINQKFVIYSAEKKKQDNTIVPSQEDNKRIQKGYEEEHEELALKLLFSKETGSYTEKDYEQITKIGLVIQVTNESIVFLHRTFAEYFVATYIQKHFNKDCVIKLLLEDVLVYNDLTTLRQFINNYIRDKLNNGETINKYKQYVDKNYKTIEENNPVLNILYTAVWENNSEIATFMLECFKQNQIMLDSIMSYGSGAALDTAIGKGNIEIAKQIINCCDKNKMNKQCEAYKYTLGEGIGGDMTALQVAATRGHTEVVSLLLAKGASVDIADDTLGWTALHRAASGGHTVIVQQLIDHGADVNITENKGLTVLQLAIYFKHTGTVELLQKTNTRQ